MLPLMTLPAMPNEMFEMKELKRARKNIKAQGRSTVTALSPRLVRRRGTPCTHRRHQVKSKNVAMTVHSTQTR
ncbi:Hypp7100 [Branchiostoma lanceolatum]|uniref:Hypp7100 protein n=1 Tax=Branchiostoma lanceolatum TaxID=7740 RepID=A0A8J9YXM3_BRALA|nr:Hypp7100 [Branchiostoma lanceolatum]